MGLLDNNGLLGGLNKLTSDIRKATSTVQQSVNGINSATRSVTSTLDTANRTKESVKQLGQRAKGSKTAKSAKETTAKSETTQAVRDEEPEAQDYYIKNGVKYKLKEGERPPEAAEPELQKSSFLDNGTPAVRTAKYFCIYCGKQYDEQEDGKCPFCCAPGEDR